MQFDIETEVPDYVLQLLKETLCAWRDGSSPVWCSTWPVFERFIERHDEMQFVYRELAANGVTDIKLWNLLEQFIFSGTFSKEENHAELRADYDELTALNDSIGEVSTRLAEMIERRSEILNNSGHFHCDRMVSLPELIDEAGRGNAHYESFLRGELAPLKRYDLKYWPGIADILHVIGLEHVDIEFTDRSTEAIVNARRPSLTDYFRALFDRISDLKTGGWDSLPRDFRMTDNALATICNVALNLPAEDVIDAAYVKRTRHRLKAQSFTAGW
ncbi:hypothetical protein KX75_20235 [Salmonella enterica subsp. enterica]|nr:hypothetical protein [Salmonella enterica subsp. enterica serovar Mikawasima]EDN7229201.1 hypothetical protein [Salmonella enterica subsp. enterica serovar Mikawasima]